jgi:hypothetical protein
VKPVQHWKCLSCKGYNDVLNMSCSFCRVDKPGWLTSLYQIGVELDRGIFFGYGVLGYGLHTLMKREAMTPEEELFSKFYNHERPLVKDMEYIALRAHRDELAKIAFEAKARLTAVDDELRERKAKTSKKEWLVTETGSVGNVDVTNAINVVEKRKARMSKMDKLTKQLRDMGMDDAIVKEMTRNMEARATDSKLKTLTFKPSNGKAETPEIPKQFTAPTPQPASNKPNPFVVFTKCPVCKLHPCECRDLAPVLNE